MKERYPSLGKKEDEEGVVPDAVLEKMKQTQKKQDFETKLTQHKNATPAEAATSLDRAFVGVMPLSLVEERTSDSGLVFA